MVRIFRRIRFQSLAAETVKEFSQKMVLIELVMRVSYLLLNIDIHNYHYLRNVNPDYGPWQSS